MDVRESFAAPRGVEFAAATEREERISVLTQGNGGTVRERLHGPKEVGTLQNLFQGNGKLRFLQILFCAILLTLGISSAVMGVLAEFYSSQEKEIMIGRRSCVYPGDLVIAFCTHASIFLIVAQVLAIVFGWSVCCSAKGSRPNVDGTCRNSPAAAYASESIGITYFLASWVFCLLALYYFEAADMTRASNKMGTTCTVVKPLVFIKGSAFALAAMTSSLIFYLAKCAAKLSGDADLESSEDESLV